MHTIASSSTIEDTALNQLVTSLDALIAPMHFLDELQAVWGDLSDEARAEITSSRVYRERDHERSIEASLEELREPSEQLRGFKYRGLRKSIKQFRMHWKALEPDQVKILKAQVKKFLEEV